MPTVPARPIDLRSGRFRLRLSSNRAEFDARQSADNLARYSDTTRIGAAHGRRPVDRDASRDPWLRLRYQSGRAHGISGGRELLVCRLGDRTARFANSSPPAFEIGFLAELGITFLVFMVVLSFSSRQ